MADVLTVRGAVARAKADGLPVSEYTLRGWIKAGVIPVRHAGSKQLLYYPNLVRYLQCEDGGDNSPATVRPLVHKQSKRRTRGHLWSCGGP